MLLPIVEMLADCETDAERAVWLLAVPDGIILRDHHSIQVVLLNARFRRGIDYMCQRLALLNAVRDGKGAPDAEMAATLETLRSLMIAIAAGSTIRAVQ